MRTRDEHSTTVSLTAMLSCGLMGFEHEKPRKATYACKAIQGRKLDCENGTLGSSLGEVKTLSYLFFQHG